jgi:hypothetical protein
MIVVSSKDFASRLDKYFDLAIDEQVIVNRGDYSFRIVLDTMPKEQKILQPDNDLRNAITIGELRESTHEHIRKLFSKK